MSYEHCSRKRRDSIIAVEENGRRFEIRNPKRRLVTQVRIDGCVIADDRERCDYLFEIGDKCHCAAFVELKGADVRKAYSQLVSTLGILASQYARARVLCFIVASRVPRITPGVQQLAIKMANQHRAHLKVGTVQLEVDVERELHP